MTPIDLYDLFRGAVDDKVQPYLWTDQEVWAYMDDAQRKFCRFGYGIPDSRTAEVVEVRVEADEPWVDLHPSIVNIRRAALRSTQRPITVSNFEDMDNPGAPQNDYGSKSFSRSTLLDDTTGTIDYMVLGMEENQARLVRVPAEDDTIDLIVYREPVTRLNENTGDTAVFEISDEHHLHLMDWMRYHAYKKQDAETFDEARSNAAGKAFVAYCEEARKDWDRKRHKPRLMVYGGI